MKLALVQFTPWDKCYFFDARDFILVVGEKVVVKTDLGTELGIVVKILDLSDEEAKKMMQIREERKEDVQEDEEIIPESEKSEEGKGSNSSGQKETEGKATEKAVLKDDQAQELKPVLRKATLVDIGKSATRTEKERAIKECKDLIAKHNLPMKLVDVHFAFDGSRLTFAFIADGRVDFRDLVKDLTRNFNRTIRLQQIGIRDEAKIMGDVGHCGRPLCCRGHLKDLQSITSEMAELQQCAHRGSERISGVCGRLMCCLAYEQAGYENIASFLPPLGSTIKVEGKAGTVVNRHILKRTVDVQMMGDNGEAGGIVEVDLNKKR